jgi:hypothetical protein
MAETLILDSDDLPYDPPAPTATKTGGCSPRIGQLAAALAKAQAEIGGASKSKTNPHFKSAYADLAEVWEACRAPLAKHGLAILQPVSAQGPMVTVTTLLTHASGEWISSDLTMTAQQNTPQGIGSCITYARRYALSSMVGVAPEDDDGNAASQGSSLKAVPQKPPVPAGFDDWLSDLYTLAEDGSAALKTAWTKSQPYLRKYLTDTQPEVWEAIKARAAKATVPA